MRRGVGVQLKEEKHGWEPIHTKYLNWPFGVVGKDPQSKDVDLFNGDTRVVWVRACSLKRKCLGRNYKTHISVCM
jgi:hypothetical protein